MNIWPDFELTNTEMDIYHRLRYTNAVVDSRNNKINAAIILREIRTSTTNKFLLNATKTIWIRIRNPEISQL